MKTRILLSLPLMFALANSSLAQVSNPDLIGRIPAARPDAPVPSPPPALPPPATTARAAVTNKVDAVLERIERSLQNTPESDAALEQTVTRQMNLLQSTDRALRPVGFVSVGDSKYILITRDGKTVTRLREGSSMGPIKVVQIEEGGVNYKVGEKMLFSPLSFQTSEPPKAPQTNSQQGGSGQIQGQGPVAGAGNAAGAQGAFGR